MKFSPKCRSKKLRMTYIILGSFCLFFNWEGADILACFLIGKGPIFGPKSGLGKPLLVCNIDCV